MISFPIEILFQRIIHTLDKDIIPSLGPSFSKVQATGIVSLLSNIAPRLELQCKIIKEEIEENRTILREIITILGKEKKHLRLSLHQIERLTKLENQLNKVSSPSLGNLVDENKKLLQILVDTIRVLNSLETIMPTAIYSQLKDKMRGHMRRQLNREMSFLTSTKFGRMSSV
jgi:hypothetical protein